MEVIMIPQLYENDISKDKQIFLANLTDCLSCEVTEERNGSFECILTYPVSGIAFSSISRDRVILAKPNHSMEDQFFRIYRITKPLGGIISVYAQHISYDLSDKYVMPFKLTKASPVTVMTKLFENSGYTFSTDYSSGKGFSVDVPKSVRACLGGSEGSMLSLWHGEFTFDNFNVRLNTHRGTDNGVSIRYGKNLTELNYDEDNTTLYTEVLPYAVRDAVTYTLKAETIPVASAQMSRKKTLIVDLSSEFDNDEEISETKLKAKADEYITNNAVGTLVPSISVSFEPFTSYDSDLDSVSLCDTVSIEYEDYGIQAKAKVTKTIYDTLLERYTSIVLGEAKASMTDTLQKQISNVSVKATKQTERFAKRMDTAIDDATKRITGASGGYVVTNVDENGQPFEILIMDKPTIDTAKKIWRWNSAGLGYSSNGYEGPFSTAITADGSIVADFITSGALTANLITAGTIQSFDNSSYWDIESGDIVIGGNAEVSGKINAESGEIAGWCIAGSANPPNGFWNYSLSSVIKNNTTQKQYAVFLRGGKTLNSGNVIIGIKEMSTDYQSNSTNWSNSKKSDGTYPSDAEYSFYVRADGKMMASNAAISSGDGTAKVSVADGGLSFYTTVSNALKQYGLIKATIDGNIDSTKPMLCVQSNPTNSAGLAISCSASSWYLMLKDGIQVNPATTSTKHQFYGNAHFKNIIYADGSIYTGNNFVMYGRNYLYAKFIDANGNFVSERLIGVTSNNNVAIGTTTNVGNVNIYASNAKAISLQAGTVKANDTTLATGSDRRIKEDISDISEKYLAFFSNLRPVRFKYINGQSHRTHLGFIAQEVYDALEKSDLTSSDFAGYVKVESDEEGLDGYELDLRYDEFISLNTFMIQKLMKRVDELENEIQNMKGAQHGDSIS